MKIAIIGLGSIGTRHAKDIIAIGGGHPLALYDIDPEAQARVGDLGEFVYWAQSHEQLWAWEPAAAIICTPPDSHITWALSAARRGCHVFIEKPLSLNMVGVGELDVELAKRGLVSHVACPLRYVPALAGIKVGVKAGRYGSNLRAAVDGLYYLPATRPDYKSAYMAQTGALLDIGSHAADLLIWMLGAAVLEGAMLRPGYSIGLQCEGGASVALRHSRTSTSTFHVSWADPVRQWTFAITGDSAQEVWDMPPEGIDSAYRAEMVAFLAACHAGKGADNPVSEAAQTLALLLEAKQWQGR